MDENNNIESIKNALGIMSVALEKIGQDVDLNKSSAILEELVLFFQNIPDDVKDTKFFKKIEKLKGIDIQYEDILWLNKDYGYEFIDDNRIWLTDKNKTSDLLEYIKNTINSEILPKREKVVILLAHIEPLIYYVLKISKTSNSKVKQEVKKISVDNNTGMSIDSFSKLFILAITYIVFSNTGSFKNPIDKRIPFRNNILHNGIVSYGDQEVEQAYELLVDYICMLVNLGDLLLDNN